MIPGKYQTVVATDEKPIPVEAIQFREYETVEELLVWIGPESNLISTPDSLEIFVPSADHTVNQIGGLGDWFVKGEDDGVTVVTASDFPHEYVPFGFDATTVSPTIDIVTPILVVDGVEKPEEI